MPSNLYRIALTSGEPAGIGPDLCIHLAQQPLDCEIITIGDPQLLVDRAKLLNISVEIEEFDVTASPSINRPGVIKILPVKLPEKVHCGLLDKKNSRAVLKVIDKAVKGTVDGTFNAMVTAPVHKGIINEAGISFSGHTEYIAKICGGQQPVMMLATPGLRVALVTTHLPLSRVSEAITHSRLRTVICTLQNELSTRFKLENPRILVCGLNPHAGEDGHLGHEEQTIITPVINGLCSQGLNLVGPLPADTLFTPKYLQKADAVLAMYHDQGLPVLKHMGFGKAVNITLGLPIIRTSVDHGTALDLAGSGKADSGSLMYAVETARNLITHV